MRHNSDMQIWLWVTLPETWSQHDLSLGTAVTWSCHEDTRTGDIALLYRAELATDFSHVFKVTESAHKDAELAKEWGLDWWCSATVALVLRHPIGLPTVRSDRRLQTWVAAQLNFHGSAFAIDPAEWRALAALASPIDRPQMRNIGAI
jgi:hypothetical protein